MLYKSKSAIVSITMCICLTVSVIQFLATSQEQICNSVTDCASLSEVEIPMVVNNTVSLNDESHIAEPAPIRSVSEFVSNQQVLESESETCNSMLESPLEVNYQNYPATPVEHEIFAHLSFPVCSIDEDIYYGLDDYVLNDKQSWGLWIRSDDPSKNSTPGNGKLYCIGRHNYHGGNKINTAQVGDTFKINTGYGEYDYTVIFAQVCLADGDNYQLNGEEVLDWTFSDGKEYAVLYTCYPAWADITDYRFVVIGELTSRLDY